MKLQTGPWLPDQPDFANPGLIRAENVIPAGGHYRSFPSASTLGILGMTGPAEGITVGLRPTADAVLFAGSGGVLWRIPGLVTPPVNVSRDAEYDTPYTMLPGDRWRFVQYGNLLLATNLREPIQSNDLVNAANAFGDLPNAPKARYIARIRDFVVLGYIDEPPDGEAPYRLRWHGFNTATGLPDITEWTVSLETRSDFQDVSDLGVMTGLTGGQFGIALFRRGLARIDFGGQFLFEPRVVDNNIGCMVPGSVVQYGAETYFWSDEGIFKTAGGPAVPVGTERVNRYLRNNLDLGRIDEVWAQPDYSRGIIVWILPLTGGSRLLVYRPAVDQFSTLEVDIDSLGPMISFGLDLDDETEFPDLDTDPRNLDDPSLWESGLLRLGGQLEDVEFDLDYGAYETGTDLVSFDGSPLEGLLEWSEMEPGDGSRFCVNWGVVYHEGGAAQIVIRSREQVAGAQSSLVTYGPYNPQSDGIFRFKANGRYHRARVLMTGDWQSIRGLDARGARLGR